MYLGTTPGTFVAPWIRDFTTCLYQKSANVRRQCAHHSDVHRIYKINVNECVAEARERDVRSVDCCSDEATDCACSQVIEKTGLVRLRRHVQILCRAEEPAMTYFGLGQESPYFEDTTEITRVPPQVSSRWSERHVCLMLGKGVPPEC